MTTADTQKRVHHGKNIRRFREMLDMKQEALAIELGDDWTQRKISLLEAKETVEPAILEQIANVLKLPVKAIENFTEEAAYNVIGNTVNTVNDNATVFQFNPIINPIEKWIESVNKIEKLYEQLLTSEREKNSLLQQQLNKS